MDPLTTQIIVVFAFGVIFVIALIVLAVAFPAPTPFQYAVFRIVLALAASGVAAMVPGFLNIELTSSVGVLIRAGGALAVFVIVFFFNPAQIAASLDNHNLSQDDDEEPAQRMQTQEGGDGSINIQAGRDINVPTPHDAARGKQ